MVPSVSHVEIGHGGLNHYRGTLMALASLLPTVAHQPRMRLLQQQAWNWDNLSVRSWGKAGHLVGYLRAAVTRDDVVIKYAGAFGVQTDVLLDRALLELKRAIGCRVVYADPDGPHRLPLLHQRCDTPWRNFDAVWCFQGGSRAAKEYGALMNDGADRVQLAPFAVSALPAVIGRDMVNIQPVSTWQRRHYDVVATIGKHSAREDRMVRMLAATARVRGPANPLRIGWCGEVNDDLQKYFDSHGIQAESSQPCDPHELLAFYGLGKYTLNLLRDECRDYADVPACRLFEAAAMGSVPISENFAGLEKYFRAGEHLLLTGHADHALPATVTREHAVMSAAARARAEMVAGTGVRELSGLLRDLPRSRGQDVDRPWPRSRPAELVVVGEWPTAELAAVRDLVRPHKTLFCAPEQVISYPEAAFAVTAQLKNLVDARLRDGGVVAPDVVVLVSGSHGASVRWVPGRDIAFPDDSDWPWSTTPATVPATEGRTLETTSNGEIQS